MVGKQLYICDVEPVYLKRLSAYLNRHSGFGWRIKTYGRLEVCLQEKPENLLVSGRAWAAFGKEADFPGCRLLFLDDGSPLPEGKPALKKYQSARRLCEALELAFGGGDKTPAKVIGIYVPAGGPEAEAAARRIAKERKKEGEILILGLTEFPVFSGEEQGKASLGEWFYYQKQEDGRKGIGDFIYREGEMDYIRGFRTVYDMIEVGVSDWRTFFEKELYTSRYTEIFLLFDRLPIPMELMLWCDEIYALWGWDGYGEAREQLFNKMAVYMGVSDLTDKIINIQEASDGGKCGGV